MDATNKENGVAMNVDQNQSTGNHWQWKFGFQFLEVTPNRWFKIGPHFLGR